MPRYKLNSFSGGASLGAFNNMSADAYVSGTATPNSYTDLYTPVLDSEGQDISWRGGENIVIMGAGNSVTGSDRKTYPAQGILVNGSGNSLSKISPGFKAGIMIHGYGNIVSGADDAWGANPSDEINYGHGAAIFGYNNNIGHTYADFIAGTRNATVGYAYGPAFILGTLNSGTNITSNAFIAGYSNNTINTGIYDTGMAGGCMIGKNNNTAGNNNYLIGTGNTASGNSMYAFGTSNTVTGLSNSNLGSMVFGKSNQAGKDQTYILGRNNISITAGMIGIGSGNTNLANQNVPSIFMGSDNTVATTAYEDGTNQIPAVISLGYRTKVISPNTIAFGMTPASVAVGAMQTTRTAMFIYANSSTTLDATPVAGVNQINIETDSTVGFKYTVTARRTDVDGGSAYWEGSGLIRNDAGTTALVGAVTKTKIAAEGITTADVDFTADNTNNGLIVTFTGEAAKTIRWYASVDCNSVVG